ncbi:MAG TPA: DUF6084 family protein [Candidatus Elarobacter sp.]|nr:DUF6084 family protein [Candidatus Elarobacter sp.]
MSELVFTVTGARPERFAASPQLALRMNVRETTGTPVHAIALRAQIRIEPQRRRYDGGESDRLTELFGPPERYGDTLRPMLWTHVAQTVVAFEDETEFDLVVPCSYDFEVAAHKYLAALAAGEIPIVVQLSGTLFVRAEDGGVAVERVPWSCEAHYRLPVAVWRETMDAFFPNAAWIRLGREAFDALYRFKRDGGFPTWDAAVERLCGTAEPVR